MRNLEFTVKERREKVSKGNQKPEKITDDNVMLLDTSVTVQSDAVGIVRKLKKDIEKKNIFFFNK